MRFYVISDNIDTQIGLRLAGIDGVVVHQTDEIEHALRTAMEMEDVGVLLITERLADLCPDLVDQLKMTSTRPLIVEIPDRHGGGRAGDSIARYVREAIGIKI